MATYENREELRFHLVSIFADDLVSASEENELTEALEDLAEIERFIIGETE